MRSGVSLLVLLVAGCAGDGSARTSSRGSLFPVLTARTPDGLALLVWTSSGALDTVPLGPLRAASLRDARECGDAPSGTAVRHWGGNPQPPFRPADEPSRDRMRPVRYTRWTAPGRP